MVLRARLRLLAGKTVALVAVAEHPDARADGAVVHDTAAVEHHGAGADVGDLLRGVAHEDDRAALLLELADLVHALELERLVADREHLVDEQEVGVGVDGDGEREPHVHAR